MTLPPLVKESVVTEITTSTTSLDVPFVNPVWLATFSTRFALFIVLPPRITGHEELVRILAEKHGGVKKPHWAILAMPSSC